MFRRSKNSIYYPALVALAALVLFSSMAVAKDKPEESIKVEKTEDGLIITTVDPSGQCDTQVIDLTGIGEMVQDVLADFETTQFQLRLGQDNMLSLAMDDTAIEVDLDVILSQVGAVISDGLDELHTSQWANKGPRDESLLADDMLVAELDKLRAEMRSLRRELKKLKAE